MATGITAIAYETVNAKGQGGTGSIDPFNLDPLYWHVEPDGFGKLHILIDQNPPNSIKGIGRITDITIKYTAPVLGSPEQTMFWDDPGVDFSGNQLVMYIKVIDVLSNPRAVLVLDDGATVVAADPTMQDGDHPYISTLVLSSAVTGGDQRAYYVNIPLQNQKAASDASLSWTKHGGVAGPIGSINVP
ncbi:MAG: hypothetical protein JWO66_447 [Candidatus Eremiobacteraeota bacterium]|nr:hypothetical protein [Candidatus Eremiobacteraeota bacterium]